MNIDSLSSNGFCDTFKRRYQKHTTYNFSSNSENVIDFDKQTNGYHSNFMPEYEINSILARPIHCPICNENFTVLNKSQNSFCSKCGYRPLQSKDYVNTNSYNENLTAEDILREWWGAEMQKINSCQRKHFAYEDRCKCSLEKDGKLCAYCRVKEDCRELIEDLSKKFDNESIKNLINNIRNDGGDGQNLEKQEKKNISTICKDYKNKSVLMTRSNLEEIRRIYGPKLKKKQSKLNCNKKIRPHQSKLHCSTRVRSQKSNHLRMQNRKIQNVKNLRREQEKFKPINHKRNKEFHDDSKTIFGDTHRGIEKKSRRKFKRKKRKFRIPKSIPRATNRHSKCVPYVRVPRNMGYLWTVFTERNSKWKPGYIPKDIRELMDHFIRRIDVLPLHAGNNQNCPPGMTGNEIRAPIQKSTLHIKRVNGEITIAMRPLKDEKSLRESANPYLDMKPIKFRLSKKPESIMIHEFKVKLREKGFKKCKCRKSFENCNCRSEKEKLQLEKEIQKLCCESRIKNLQDDIFYLDSSESESDLDIDFTPPVGLIKPCLLRKPDAACKSTQYDPKDCKKPEPYESPFKINHPNYKPPIGKFGKTIQEKSKKMTKTPPSALEKDKKFDIKKTTASAKKSGDKSNEKDSRLQRRIHYEKLSKRDKSPNKVLKSKAKTEGSKARGKSEADMLKTKKMQKGGTNSKSTIAKSKSKPMQCAPLIVKDLVCPKYTKSCNIRHSIPPPICCEKLPEYISSCQPCCTYTTSYPFCTERMFNNYIQGMCGPYVYC